MSRLTETLKKADIKTILQFFISHIFASLIVSFSVYVFSTSINFLNEVFSSDLIHIAFMLPVLIMIKLIEKKYASVREKIDDEQDLIYSGLLAFFFSLLSHSSGASVGKEGVGVMFAVSVSFCVFRLMCDIGYLSCNDKDIFISVAEGCAFGALFGAPVAGVVFGLLQMKKKQVFSICNIITLCTCVALSVLVVMLFKMHIIRCRITDFSFDLFSYKIYVAAILLMVVCAFANRLYFALTENIKHICDRYRFLPYIITLFIIAICYLYYYLTDTVAVTGLSSSFIYKSFVADVNWVDLIFKFILFVLCISVGFKGGCVVPVLVIGSLLGSVVCSFFSLNPQIFSAMGVVGMFSAASGFPLLAIALGCEIFGYHTVLFYIPVAVGSYLLSGRKHIF